MSWPPIPRRVVWVRSPCGQRPQRSPRGWVGGHALNAAPPSQTSALPFRAISLALFPVLLTRYTLRRECLCSRWSRVERVLPGIGTRAFRRRGNAASSGMRLLRRPGAEPATLAGQGLLGATPAACIGAPAHPWRTSRHVQRGRVCGSTALNLPPIPCCVATRRRATRLSRPTSHVRRPKFDRRHAPSSARSALSGPRSPTGAP